MAHLCPDPPPRGLRGKVAIVTGAGCAGEGIGNGRAMSIMLADEGCNIVCVDLQSSWVDKTCEMANAKAGRGKAVSRCADVTSADDCAAVVQFAMDEFGRLDILVNNVGVTGPGGTALDTDLEQWAPAFEVNVASMVKMAKFAIPAMMKNEGKENRGVIINMGSIAGLKGGTPDLLYPTSKGAVFNMTRAMAAHHARDGIRVNCVCPGVSSFISPALPAHFIENILLGPLHTHGVLGRYERRDEGVEKKQEFARHRRHCLGLCWCCCVSGKRPCEMDNWHHAPR